MTVPYIFASATAPLPLSQLDSNFATAITLGSTSLTLGSTVTSVAGLTLTSATISSLSSALSVGNGGTGLTTLTAGYIPYGNGTSAFGSSANLFWDSANSRLGIGTSSPATSLEVAATGVNQVGTVYTNINAINSAKTLGLSFGYDTANGGVIASGGVNKPVAFWRYDSGSTNYIQSAVIDGSGNLGLGVTPSAWSSGFKALQIGSGLNGGAIAGDTSFSTLYSSSNAYNNSGWKYVKTGEGAALFRVYGYDGSFYWDRASSGTAGGTITFTTAMTLDASGRLQIGTTTATGVLSIVAPASNEYGAFDAPTAGYAFLRLKYNGTGYGNFGQASAVISGGSNTDLGFNATNNMLFATNGTTERARIDSSGNFQVGSYGGTAKINSYGNSPLRLYDATLGNQSDLVFPSANTLSITSYYSTGSNITFGTNSSGGGNAERMRIDSSGNLLVGTTSTNGSASNSNYVTGGIFSTNNGIKSVLNATATTLATLSNFGQAVYLVTAGIPAAGNPTQYSSVAVISTQATATNVTILQAGIYVVISTSGLDIQVTQTAGATYNISWSVLRLN